MAPPLPVVSSSKAPIAFGVLFAHVSSAVSEPTEEAGVNHKMAH
jgi:hypothetical protein